MVTAIGWSEICDVLIDGSKPFRGTRPVFVAEHFYSLRHHRTYEICSTTFYPPLRSPRSFHMQYAGVLYLFIFLAEFRVIPIDISISFRSHDCWTSVLRGSSKTLQSVFRTVWRQWIRVRSSYAYR